MADGAVAYLALGLGANALAQLERKNGNPILAWVCMAICLASNITAILKIAGVIP